MRSSKLKERMEGVRNLREEAAVHAELEMVRRALENDEQEALSLLDQIRRIEERLEEQEAAYKEAPGRSRAASCRTDPRAAGHGGSPQGARREKGKTFAEGIDPKERRVYESIMAGSTDVAVSELTQDGACGNCFSLVPLQVQNEIRHHSGMIRCEGCGVILTPESAEGIARAEAENVRIMDALRATEEEREIERAVVAEAIADGGGGGGCSRRGGCSCRGGCSPPRRFAPAAEASEPEAAPPEEEAEPEAAPAEEAALAEEATEPETAPHEESRDWLLPPRGSVTT